MNTFGIANNETVC